MMISPSDQPRIDFFVSVYGGQGGEAISLPWAPTAATAEVWAIPDAKIIEQSLAILGFWPCVLSSAMRPISLLSRWGLNSCFVFSVINKIVEDIHQDWHCRFSVHGIIVWIFFPVPKYVDMHSVQESARCFPVVCPFCPVQVLFEISYRCLTNICSLIVYWTFIPAYSVPKTVFCEKNVFYRTDR